MLLDPNRRVLQVQNPQHADCLSLLLTRDRPIRKRYLRLPAFATDKRFGNTPCSKSFYLTRSARKSILAGCTFEALRIEYKMPLLPLPNLPKNKTAKRTARVGRRASSCGSNHGWAEAGSRFELKLDDCPNFESASNHHVAAVYPRIVIKREVPEEGIAESLAGEASYEVRKGSSRINRRKKMKSSKWPPAK